jgi:hypothetical protein
VVADSDAGNSPQYVTTANGDADYDGRGPGCLSGPDDCDDNQYAWISSACATCADADGDNWRSVCDDPLGYFDGINPDCDDNDPLKTDVCGPVDTDGDGLTDFQEAITLKTAVANLSTSANDRNPN